MNVPEPSKTALAGIVNAIVDSGFAQFPMRIGATGHRVLEGETRDWVARELDGLFSRLARSNHSRFRAVSSLAAGTDQLFAEAALGHGIPLDVVVPFTHFAEDFPEGSERDTYQRFLSAAASTTCLPWRERSNGAYLAGGFWVVDHCDLLIAVWDGEAAAGIGGTGDVVDYSSDSRKPCIHMRITSLRVEVLT